MDEAFEMRKVERRRKYAARRLERQLQFERDCRWRSRLREGNELTCYLSDKYHWLRDEYEEVCAKVVIACGQHSAILPPKYLRVRGRLPSEYRMAIRQALVTGARLEMPNGSPIPASIPLHTKVMYLIDAYLRKDPDKAGYHLYLRSEFGSMGYYIDRRALRTFGFDRQVIHKAAEDMFRGLEQTV